MNSNPVYIQGHPRDQEIPGFYTSPRNELYFLNHGIAFGFSATDFQGNVHPVRVLDDSEQAPKQGPVLTYKPADEVIEQWVTAPPVVKQSLIALVGVSTAREFQRVEEHRELPPRDFGQHPDGFAVDYLPEGPRD